MGCEAPSTGVKCIADSRPLYLTGDFDA